MPHRADRERRLMSKRPYRHTTVSDRVLFCGLVLYPAAPVCHGEPVASEQWSFVVTPYVWAPSIDATLKFNVPPGAGGRPNVGVGPTKLSAPDPSVSAATHFPTAVLPMR